MIITKHFKYGDLRADGFKFTGYAKTANGKTYAMWRSPESLQKRKASAIPAQRSFKKKLKLEVYEHYGNKCALCSEDDFDVLVIDHINQKGSVHKRDNNLHDGQAVRQWLRVNNYPKGFRLLCANCNIKVYRLFQRKIKKEQL